MEGIDLDEVGLLLKCSLQTRLSEVMGPSS